MGYRSAVSFCLKVKEPEKFLALLKLKNNEVINDMMKFMYLDDDGLLHFYHEAWKWYDDSEKALVEIMEMADNYDEDFAAKLARYGEESDDIQEEDFGEDGSELDYPYVTRSLELGFSPNTAKKILEEENENNHPCEPA
jgi:hypothetical protein